MEAQKIEVNVAEGCHNLTILKGEAAPVQEPRIINIEGVLNSPAEWLKSRKDTINEKKCHVVVNREDMTIDLVVAETEYYNTTIVGFLQLHPKFKEFGINSGEYMTNFEMAELIKMNRIYFENITTAHKLVTELKNFRIKCEKEIEKADNNRGDYKAMIVQTVKESNLPESFKLQVPIFKGNKKQTFEVEVYVRASDYCCSLVSPDANDIIETSRDKLIDEVIKEIRNTCPDIVIIEQ